MKKKRLEALSDGVFAIIFTIMVLSFKAPEGAALSDLQPLIPTFGSYIFSFVILGIYWNIHHQILRVSKKVDAKTMWANLHLLLWLSLIPFATSWIGEHHPESGPLALYGIILLMSAIAYYILQTIILHKYEKKSRIRKAIGYDLKGKSSLVLYSLGIFLCYVNIWIAILCYSLVAIIWIIPDKRLLKE